MRGVLVMLTCALTQGGLHAVCTSLGACDADVCPDSVWASCCVYLAPCL